MIKKGDQDGISLQSSINYLQTKMNRAIPAITSVYKYGLLKPEGTLMPKTEGSGKKEISETDLQNLSFSFIHLSFQEFLTSLYFVRGLLSENNEKEQNSIASFIARHRNEPRYLMTLKLMAGLLSSESNQAEQGIKIFWDAVMCNVDGILELGVEAKVTLLMHLISQSKIEEKFDERIPNLDQAVKMIDEVVLQDLSGWSIHLKESDYMTEKVRAYLIEYFLFYESSDRENRLKKIANISNQNIDRKNLLDLILSMSNRFSEEQLTQVFQESVKLLKNHHTNKWQLTRKAIEVILIGQRKGKFNLDFEQEKEVLAALVKLVDDNNIADLSLKAIRKIIEKSTNPEIAQVMKRNLKQSFEDLKTKNEYVRMSNLVQTFMASGLNDIQFVEDALNAFKPLLSEKETSLNILALKTTIELINLYGDNDVQQIKKTIDVETFTPLLRNRQSNVRLLAGQNIIEFIKMCGKSDIQLIKDVTRKVFIPILQESDQKIHEEAEQCIIKLIKEFNLALEKANGMSFCYSPAENGLGNLLSCFPGPTKTSYSSQDDIKFVQEVITIFTPLFDEDFKRDQKIKNQAEKSIMELVKIGGNSDIQLVKNVIKTIFVPIFHQRIWDSNARENIKTLVEHCHDVQLTKEIIDILISSLEERDSYHRKPVFEIIRELLKNWGKSEIQHAKQMIKTTLTPLLQVENPEKRDRLFHKGFTTRELLLETIIELMNRCCDNELQSVKEAVKNALIPLLQHEDFNIQISAAEELLRLCNDFQFLREVIKSTIIPLLHDSESKVKEVAFEVITSSLKRNGSSDIQFTKEIIQTTFPSILQRMNPQSGEQIFVVKNAIELAKVYGESDIKLVKDVIRSTILPFLQCIDKNPNLKEFRLWSLSELVKYCNDIHLVKEMIEPFLTLLLQDSSFEAQEVFANHTLDLVTMFYKSEHYIQLIQDVIETFVNLLVQHRNGKLSNLHLSFIERLVEKCRSNDIRLDQNVLKIILFSFPQRSENYFFMRKECVKICGGSDIQFGKEVMFSIIIPLLNKLNRNMQEIPLRLMIRLIENWDNIQHVEDVIKSILTSFVRNKETRQQGWVQPLLTELLEKYGTNLQFTREIMKFFNQLSQIQSLEEREIFFTIMRKIIKIVHDEDSIKLFEEILNTSFTQLLTDPNPDIQKSALDGISGLYPKNKYNKYAHLKDIATSKNSKYIHLVNKTIITTLIPLLQDSNLDIRKAVLRTTTELATDAQLAQKTIQAITPLLQDTDSDLRLLTIKSFIELAVISRNQFAREALQTILTFFAQYKDCHLEESDIESLTELLEICGKSEPQLVFKALNVVFTPIFQQSMSKIRKLAVSKAKWLLKDCENNDIQLAKQTIKTSFIPLLQGSEDYYESMNVLEIITDLLKRCGSHDVQFVKNIIKNTLLPLVQGTNSKIRPEALQSMGQLAITCAESDASLVKETIEIMTPLIKGKWQEMQDSTKKILIELVKIYSRYDLDFVQNCLQTILTPIFKGEDRIGPWNDRVIIETFVEFHYDKHAHIIQDVIKMILIPPFSNEKHQLCITVLNSILELEKKYDRCDMKLIQEILKAFNLLLQDKNGDNVGLALNGISKFIKILRKNDAQHFKDAIKITFAPFLLSDDQNLQYHARLGIKNICEGNDNQFVQDIIQTILVPLLQERDLTVLKVAAQSIVELLKIHKASNTEHVKDAMKTIFIPILQERDLKRQEIALDSLIELAKLCGDNDIQLVKDAIKTNFIPLLHNENVEIRESVVQIITKQRNSWDIQDSRLPKEIMIEGFLFLLQFSGPLLSDVETFKKSCLNTFILPENLANYLQLPLKSLRDALTSFLLPSMKEYIANFGTLEKARESRRGMGPQLDKIGDFQGPQIIELVMILLGKLTVSDGNSEGQELIELAKEILNIKLRDLNDKDLGWISENSENLLSLSPEAKIFCKKILHTLLEDNKITPLEQQLIIKFIQQGLTTSITRGGEMIFEGRQYKILDTNAELGLEKIAKTIIRQQQDPLAQQYKDHKPIFKKASLRGMKQAAADVNEVRSIMDSRYTLGSDFWILTRLKSLKFRSELVILEQRSAFGDHVIYHFGEDEPFRLYPGTKPEKSMLLAMFGSYIFGEVYEGQSIKLPESVGQRMFEKKDKALQADENEKVEVIGSHLYFQQELLGGGREDRDDDLLNRLASKLDNNHKKLKDKLASFDLSESQKLAIEQYYEGFVSTFSSVYTSSQAIDSGKLSLDDGEDYFSPVNLFIQLSSLVPFGIGGALSEGLEAARSYLKTNKIKNQAKYVKQIAVDAVELSSLVGDTVFEILANDEKRKEILKAAVDEEQPNNLVRKIKDFITQKIEKFKNMAEKYTKLKNLFEKEIQTSPAFQLGEDDANKIINEWIEQKETQPELVLGFEGKRDKFLQIIIVENKQPQTPSMISPDEMKFDQIKQSKNKNNCCEIF